MAANASGGPASSRPNEMTARYGLPYFQNFLNSLDFSCQIFVQSRMLDIRPYIATLEAQYKSQLDDLMRIQIREYIEFIKSFTEAANPARRLDSVLNA